MQNEKEIKEVVKEKYGAIAQKSQSGCGCGCGTSNKIVGYTVMKDDYTNLDGYIAEADLGLGCGLPTEYAGIKEGDTVVDLGSGAGNDVFVARAIVGDKGKVIGLDFTEEMIDKANKNNLKLGYKNVEFWLGEIEEMPVDDSSADVVVSNCVLNLVPDKKKAFAEIFRILKPGGHFCVSDIVIKGELPANLKKSAEMYAGCVAGAVQQEEYLKIIDEAGFKNTEIEKTKVIELPDEVLKQYLSTEEIELFREKKTGIFSITVTSYKP
ncbi:protein containing Methyltransferase type 11 domain [sediment metagenome]|uniref:Arsenite methyltransferase n=1 Tax=sediment metagenome TaxID=749907 RepID=D9PGC8_9ZZZZ